MPAASYAARQPPAKESEKPITVLVTGFGPFLSKFPKNSSWEIASTLPALIPSSPNNPRPIRIIVHHEPIRVAYNTVVSLVPTLLPSSGTLYPAPDLILHIGLAASRTFFALERGAHASGYSAIPDVDGERFADARAAAKWPAEVYPRKLCSSFDADDVLERWKETLADSKCGDRDGNEAGVGVGEMKKRSSYDVRISPDAGNFMCGFIYYNSLAEFWAGSEQREGRERPVAFMHVPDLSDSQEKLDGGREVTIGLIKALVESWTRGCRNREDGKGEVVSPGGAKTDANFTADA